MIREKRLSPRRAKSRLPLSPRANSRLRLKPLLFLRPVSPKGGTPIRETPRFCTHYEYPIFDARSEGLRSSVRLRRMSSWSHGAARQQEYRLRLKRPTPIRRGARFPPFNLDPSRQARGSCSHAFLRRAQTATRVPVLERKIAPRLLFLSKTESKRSPERRGEQRPTAQSRGRGMTAI